MSRLTLIGMPLLVSCPAMCTLFACRTDACMDVTRAVGVGSAGAPAAALPAELLIDPLLPPPQAEITIAAQAAAPTASPVPDVPISGGPPDPAISPQLVHQRRALYRVRFPPDSGRPTPCARRR